MPRKTSRTAVGGSDGPSDGDIRAMQEALAALLPQMAVTAFPPDVWAQLAQETLSAGYTLIVSPQMDGRAARVYVPIGTQRLQVTAGNDQELVEALRALLLQVRSLRPSRK